DVNCKWNNGDEVSIEGDFDCVMMSAQELREHIHRVQHEKRGSGCHHTVYNAVFMNRRLRRGPSRDLRGSIEFKLHLSGRRKANRCVAVSDNLCVWKRSD